MIEVRREPFGGLVYVKDSRKTYEVNSFVERALELLSIGTTFPETAKVLTEEFKCKVKTEDILAMLSKIQESIPTQIIKRGSDRTGEVICLNGHQLPRAPVRIYWNFTNLCNLRCRHCGWDSGIPYPNELDLNRCLQVLDELISLGVFELSFSGGEPLMAKEKLLTLGKYAQGNISYLWFVTNGTLINEKVINEIEKSGFCQIEVSLDGLKKSHDALRGPGTYEKAIRAIQLIKKSNLDLVVASMVQKTNFLEIDAIVNNAIQLGIPTIRFVRFVPSGRGVANQKDLILTKDEEFAVAKKLWVMKKKFKDLINIDFNFLWKIIGTILNGDEKVLPLKSMKTSNCPAGWTRACITATGDVAPCSNLASLGFFVGNLKDNSFESIWKNSPVLDIARSEKKMCAISSCKDCINKFCNGGCKAQAYGHYGNMMYPDPLCFKENSQWFEEARS